MQSVIYGRGQSNCAGALEFLNAINNNFCLFQVSSIHLGEKEIRKKEKFKAGKSPLWLHWLSRNGDPECSVFWRSLQKNLFLHIRLVLSLGKVVA